MTDKDVQNYFYFHREGTEDSDTNWSKLKTARKSYWKSRYEKHQLTLQSKPGIFGIKKTIKASSTQKASNVTPNPGNSSNKSKRKSSQTLLFGGPSRPMLTSGKENDKPQGDVEDPKYCLDVSVSASESTYKNLSNMNAFLASARQSQSFEFKHENHARAFAKKHISILPNLVSAVQGNNLVLTKYVDYSSSSASSAAGITPPTKSVAKKKQQKKRSNTDKPAVKPTKSAKKSDTKSTAKSDHIPSPEAVKEAELLDTPDLLIKIEEEVRLIHNVV